jgi:signal transduction histidine kinase
MLHDLTDQHRIKQVEKKMAQLEVVRQMASSIAHEIRNPLTAIRGSAQKLTDLSLEAKDTQLLELIMNESDRLNQIVTEFLHFARPRRLRPRRTSIRQLAEDVVLLLRQQTHEKLPEIVLDISPGESAGIDYDQMLQVFLNLGLNACQAMPEGGTLTISARSPADGQDRMRIEFADTGVGIAPEHREKLFNPFFTTKSRGTGLGLAVVERIVAAHGGWIEIGSEIGRGTKVTLWIPKEIPAAVLAEGIA